MAGDISQFFGGIKGIQRGTISLTGLSATATITSVDTTKTELRYLGSHGVTNAVDYASITLTNATTITANRSNVGGSSVVSWELTEYY